MQKINILFGFFAWSIGFSSCLDLGHGTTTLIKEVGNPTGKKKATLFLRQTGATVANSYQVSVKFANQSLGKSEVGNTFIVDANHGATGLDSASISLFWVSNDTLQIAFDKKLRTFIQEQFVDGVTILYRPR